MKVQCLKCGYKVPELNDYCPSCGTPLRWYQKNSPVTIGLAIVSLFSFAFVILLIVMM